jgi:hypothetical protein
MSIIVGVAPLKPAEFVLLEIQQMTAGIVIGVSHHQEHF